LTVCGALDKVQEIFAALRITAMKQAETKAGSSLRSEWKKEGQMQRRKKGRCKGERRADAKAKAMQQDERKQCRSKGESNAAAGAKAMQQQSPKANAGLLRCA